MQIADIFTVPDSKLIASVTSDEALQAVARLFRGEPIIAMSIPFTFPLFMPTKNVIIDNLIDPLWNL